MGEKVIASDRNIQRRGRNKKGRKGRERERAEQVIKQERRTGDIQMISLISIDDGNISHNRSADVHDEEEDGAQVQKLMRQRADKKE